MDRTEKIAIVMATCNGGKNLGEQIESILSQTCSDWELYIHDDGSTDQTTAILEEYAALYPGKIHIIEGPPTGSARDNFFFLMQSVDAPYYMFCDQDDVWLPNKVQISFDCMKGIEAEGKEEIPILVFTDLRVVDQDLRTISPRMSKSQQLDPGRVKLNQLLVQNVITGCTVMVNRRLREMACMGEDRESIIMHDWWCALIAASYGKIGYVDDAPILYRQHGGNVVGAKNVMSIGYIGKKLRGAKEMKRSVENTRRQSEAFSRAFDLKCDSVAGQYGRIENKNRIQRILFHARHGIWKSGFLRNIGLVLWGAGFG